MAAKASRLTVNQVLKADDHLEWRKAIKDEISSLLETTKSLVPETIDKSKEYHLIHSTMQLKKKMKTVTQVDKFKARCCACGSELSGAIAETYSPTVSSLAHSVLHQIAVIDDMETCLMDTVLVYLNQDYPEDATPYILLSPERLLKYVVLIP